MWEKIMPVMDQSFRISEKEIEKRHEKERKKQERFLKQHTKKNLKFCPHCELITHHDYIKGSKIYMKCAECGKIHEIENIPEFMKI